MRPAGEVGERASWDDVYSAVETPTRMLRWALTHAPMVEPLCRCDRALEVGTGTGMLSGFLARCGVAVTTLDVSPKVLGVASSFYERLGVSVERVLGDGTRLPFRSGSFDAVFSQGLWEHFADPYVQAFAEEGLRVAPVVYASVPSAFYPRLGRRGPGLVGNERLMRGASWRRALGKFGPGAAFRLYGDWKLLTVAGVSVPFPTGLLMTITAA